MVSGSLCPWSKVSGFRFPVRVALWIGVVLLAKTLNHPKGNANLKPETLKPKTSSCTSTISPPP